MNTSKQIYLSHPLPPDVIVGMTWGPFYYRKYPVFSWPWLRWRLVVVSIAVFLYGLLSMWGQRVAGESWRDAAAAMAYFVAGMMIMFTAGPALASWVRCRGWSRRVEGWAIVASAILGIAAGVAGDAWSSNHIRSSLTHVKEVPAKKRQISTVDEAALALAKLGFGFLHFAAGGGLAVLAYFSERRRLQARSLHITRLEADMKLAVLQAQIEPHFLFNALASIRPLVRQDADRAEAAIDALAQYLRAAIPQMRAQPGAAASSLGQQADMCQSYLKVMQVRMGERLRTEIAVPENLRALEFPPLMLLSLVENAIKHGIEPKPGPGWVGIRADREGDFLRVTVADDGAGLQAGLSSGLGLANIREQLEVRFAGRARLSIVARSGGGTLAEITVPLA